MVGALLLAAGNGTRMLGKIEDKLLQPIGDSNAFLLSCLAFLDSGAVSSIVIVYKNEEQRIQLNFFLSEHLAQYSNLPGLDILWVQGGKERQDSVWEGLHALPEEITHVMIHDCARPFIKGHTICELADQIIQNRAVSVARPLKDTLRLRIDGSDNPLQPSVTKTLNRANHWLMETPQGAPRKWLIQGLKEANMLETLVTDDMAALELAGYPIAMLETNYPNPKITTPDDFSYAEFLFRS
jgi:2-C-methyl-D-erythritol 4-phosphate cytidylyltransferase